LVVFNEDDTVPRLVGYGVIMITRSRSRSSEMSDSLSNEESPKNSQDSPSLIQLDSAPKDDPVPRKRKKGGGRAPPRKSDRWVCIVPETFQSSKEAEEASNGSISLVLLKDPHSSKSLACSHSHLACVGGRAACWPGEVYW